MSNVISWRAFARLGAEQALQAARAAHDAGKLTSRHRRHVRRLLRRSGIRPPDWFIAAEKAARQKAAEARIAAIARRFYFLSVRRNGNGGPALIWVQAAIREAAMAGDRAKLAKLARVYKHVLVLWREGLRRAEVRLAWRALMAHAKSERAKVRAATRRETVAGLSALEARRAAEEAAIERARLALAKRRPAPSAAVQAAIERRRATALTPDEIRQREARALAREFGFAV